MLDPEFVVSTAGAARKAMGKWLIDRTGLSAEKAVTALDHVLTPDQQTGLERLVGVDAEVVNEIAMGSRAFLEAACRYQADLVEALEAEGRADAGRFLDSAGHRDGQALTLACHHES